MRKSYRPRTHRKWIYFFLTLACYLSVFNAKAQLTRSMTDEDPPLLELGVGVMAARFPDYPGSDEYKNWILPFPAGIYRGKFLRADEEGGVRGKLKEADNYEFNLSFGGSLPTDSSDNKARNGMNNLDLVFEVGPNWLLKLKKATTDDPTKLLLSLPVRLATSVDSTINFREEGLVFNPFLYYIAQGVISDKTIFFLSFDSRFATRKYNDYYYTVEPQFATPDRAEFRAKAGYSGSGIFLAAAYLYSQKLTFFAAAYYANLNGVVNRDSPLLRSTNNTSVFAGITWWFYASEAKESSAHANDLKNLKDLITN